MLRLAILALVVPAIAHGSPRSDPTTGRAVFTGATMPNTPSLTLNPAAIGLAKTWELYAAATAVLEQWDIERANGETANDNQLGPGGSFAWFFPPGRISTIGVELKLPPPELFPDKQATRYHSLGGYQRNFIVTGGFSLKVASSFYFGVSVSHDVSFLKLRYARDTALDQGIDIDCDGAPCGIENPAAQEVYEVKVRTDKVSADNTKVNLGIMIRPRPNLWIGLTYHNTPGFGIQTQLEGKMTYTQPPRDGGATVHGRSTVLVSYPASVDGELRSRILPELDLHVGGRWEDLSRMQSFDVRGYGSSFEGFGVPEWVLRPRGFRDSFALWTGVEQVELNYDKRFRFGGRIGFETPALRPSRTSPVNMSSTSATADAGMQLRIAPNLSLQLSYGVQVFSKVDVENSAYDPSFAIDCIDSGFDYTSRGCTGLREGYGIPTAAGSYSRIQHALRIGLRYAPAL